MQKNSVQEKLDILLPKVLKPARYIGGEPNMIYKNQGEFDIRFAFCFPDTYEIGMSFMGLALLYHIVNKTKTTYFERVFAPDVDMEKLMREHDLPLYTLESKTPVRECDIVGFTLQYEMSYTNILNMLELSNIPLLSKDRDDSYPLIVGGGPCAFNPEPIADFFDLFMIGDGEDQLVELCEKYNECKKSGLSKKETLNILSNIQGVYVPILKNHTTRSFIQSLEDVDFPDNNIVPLIEVVHDRSVVELFRGCTRGCRFCQAGMIYRPVRERSVEKNTELAKAQLKNSGHNEISLLSLSSSDYTGIKALVDNLTDYCSPRQIGISLPSLRLDNFSFDLLEKIQGVKKTGLTFACEAGTQRLRDVINKNVTEEDLFNALSTAMDLGWNGVKLYFMIGLPTETDEDLDGIVELAKKIQDLAYEKNAGKHGRFNVNLAVANFVPKPFTPFQWVKQNSPEEFERKHFYLKDRLSKIKGVQLHYHGSFTSTLEAIFARGGRELSSLLLKAHELGCKFDGWSEHFNEDAWREALKYSNIDQNYCGISGFEINDTLPWDFIDAGVSKDYLINEYQKSIESQTTRDCRFGCNNCGVNRHVQCKWGGIYD